MQNWKYRILHIEHLSARAMTGQEFDNKNVQEVLDDFGGDGWELVSVLPANIPDNMFSEKDGYALVFKRPTND